MRLASGSSWSGGFENIFFCSSLLRMRLGVESSVDSIFESVNFCQEKEMSKSFEIRNSRVTACNQTVCPVHDPHTVTLVSAVTAQCHNGEQVEDMNKQ